jgi:hypothetical protein
VTFGRQRGTAARRGASSSFPRPAKGPVRRPFPRTRALSFAAAAGLLLAAPAPPVRAQLSVLETDDVRLIYMSPTQSFLAPHVARCSENSLGFQRRIWGYTPSGKLTVFLTDFADFGNAAATAVPRDYVQVEIAPLSFAFETIVANERMNWIMNHELVHVATSDQAAGADRFFRGLFRGKVLPTAEHPESILYSYLTSPRDAAPRWHREGMATFVETWMAGGQGRAQGAYDEMVFRSMVRDGSRFYDPLGLVSEGTKVDFQLEVNSYLYGTRFTSYLAHRYSPKAVVLWASRTPGSKGYYASQFEKVFGLPLKDSWRLWTEWERQFQKANLDRIRQYPITPHRDLSGQPLGSVSRAHFDAARKTLYAGFNHPGFVAHIGAISTEDGSVQRILEIKEPIIYTVTSLAYDPDGGTLFYTADNKAYRDLRALDPKTKKARTLMKDARIGDLAFNRADRSLWGVRHFNGIATLVRIPPPYTEWKQVHSWPYGEVAYDLDVSPDGRLLSASVGEINGLQSLRVLNVEALLAGDATPFRTFDFGAAIPSNFVFSPDGAYLYGSSYYTGVSNIFRYDVESGALDAVSNTETGFFRPIPIGGDTLIVFRYTGEGFVPATIEARPLEDVNPIVFLGEQIAEKHPFVKDWKVGSPAAIPLESRITRQGRYSAFRGLRLESLYPVVEGYKDFTSYGLSFRLSDPAFLNRASLTASYSPESGLPSSERYHLRADYERYDFKLSARLNAADFYDLFGPTKTSLKGHSLGLGYRKLLVYDLPRRMDLTVDATYYGGLERLPDYQNVATPFETLLTARARLSFSNQRHSLGHVDEEKGYKWDLAVTNDHVNERSFPKAYANLDLGVPLPLKHSSVWLRSSAGYSPREREEPFANFFFGGFGNNYVDHREEKRYREWYSFPGLELNEVGGTSYVKSMLEWNLPPLRFRRVGTPGFYVTWARPALFAGTLVTDLDDAGLRRVVTDVGSQLDFRFHVLSKFDMTLSVGHAVAFEDGARRRHETMVSLRVLK